MYCFFSGVTHRPSLRCHLQQMRVRSQGQKRQRQRKVRASYLDCEKKSESTTTCAKKSKYTRNGKQRKGIGFTLDIFITHSFLIDLSTFFHFELVKKGISGKSKRMEHTSDSGGEKALKIEGEKIILFISVRAPWLTIQKSTLK